MKRKLVLIEWNDAWGASTWVSNNEDKCAPAKIVSVGFVTKQSTEGYVLSASLDDTFSNVGNRQFIPQGCITKVRVLK